MNNIITHHITTKQVSQIAALVLECNTREQLGITYPLYEEVDGALHFLLYDNHDLLMAALGVFPYSSGTAECCAFVHPDHRRNGYFSHLLEKATDHFEDHDLLFGITTRCTDALAVVAAIEAELISQDYQMERSTTDLLSDCSARRHSLELRVPHLKEGVICLQLYDGNCLIGSCNISPTSSSEVCLHHVEINPPHRRQGYGYAFVMLLLEYIQREGYQTVVLHVESTNEAACSLYKKAGFQLTETLSSYCY